MQPRQTEGRESRVSGWKVEGRVGCVRWEEGREGRSASKWQGNWVSRLRRGGKGQGMLPGEKGNAMPAEGRKREGYAM